MDVRPEPFITGRIYHVYNKTIDKKSIFCDRHYCDLFIKLLRYYRSSRAIVSFSRLHKLNLDNLLKLKEQVLLPQYFRVHILAYNLMPNHYHLLLRQTGEAGISTFISSVTNALTRHYNLRSERKGQLFLRSFKAKSISTDEYLVHVSRYIHLNQYSSGLSDVDDMSRYPWSSYREYLFNPTNRLSDDSYIMELFDFKTSRYQKFVESYAEHQKTLHLLGEIREWEIVTGRKARAKYLEPPEA